MDLTTATTAPAPLGRRLGHRLTCLSCDVGWTGPETSTCWICDGPGITGPRPAVHRTVGDS